MAVLVVEANSRHWGEELLQILQGTTMIISASPPSRPRIKFTLLLLLLPTTVQILLAVGEIGLLPLIYHPGQQHNRIFISVRRPKILLGCGHQIPWPKHQ